MSLLLEYLGVWVSLLDFAFHPITGRLVSGSMLFGPICSVCE